MDSAPLAFSGIDPVMQDRTSQGGQLEDQLLSGRSAMGEISVDVHGSKIYS